MTHEWLTLLGAATGTLLVTGVATNFLSRQITRSIARSRHR